MDLSALLAAFDSHWVSYVERMESAQALNQVIGGTLAEEELTFTGCADLEKQITAQYLRSPFDLQFSGGKFASPLCPKNAQHAFLDGKLITQETLASYFFTREITLDSESKIETWKERWISRKDELQVFHYNAEIDLEGNLYAHYWNDDALDSRRKIQGPYHRMIFISGSGETPEPWSLVTHVDKVDPLHSRKLYRMSQPLAQDWSFVFAPLTFFKMGVLYGYGEVLQRLPQNFLSMRIFEVDQVRKCIIGSETKEGKSALIPEDFSVYAECALQ